jgi:outer membrane lipoprotein-sorting protein
MMKSGMLAAAFIAVCLNSFSSAAWGQSPQDKGYQIAKAANDQGKGYRDYSASGKMILTNKAGVAAVRDFDFKSMETAEGDLSLIVFNWPGDIRDTALLTHEHRTSSDDQWIFLPAERRVKRIAGAGKSGSFVGSEFAYEDMVEQNLDKFTYNWLSEEACCNVVVRIPKGADSGYSREKVWFDKSNNTFVKIEYYNLGGTLVKILTATGYQKHNGKFWRPSSMTMRNNLTGKQTTLEWRNQRFSIGLNASEFTTEAISRLR